MSQYTIVEKPQALLKVEEGFLLMVVNKTYRLSGIPLTMFVKWAKLHDVYKTATQDKKPIGTLLPVKVGDNLFVPAILCEYINEQGDRVISYEGMLMGLKTLAEYFKKNPNKTLYVPTGVASGATNSDWLMVKEMISNTLKDVVNIVYCTVLDE